MDQCRAVRNRAPGSDDRCKRYGYDGYERCDDYNSYNGNGNGNGVNAKMQRRQGAKKSRMPWNSWPDFTSEYSLRQEFLASISNSLRLGAFAPLR